MTRHVALLSLILVGAGAALADDDPRDLAILKKLEETTPVIFRDTPLPDAIVYLNDAHGAAIELDTAALKKINITEETPITLTAKELQLWRVLRDMLKSHALSFMIKGHQLTITTQQAAADWQRKYVDASNR